MATIKKHSFEELLNVVYEIPVVNEKHLNI